MTTNSKHFKRPYPRVKLHPVTVKTLKKGHPWITSDKFSDAFPGDNLFLIGLDGKGDEFSLIMNDPIHKNVRARIWDLKGPFVEEIKRFDKNLKSRIDHAFLKRNKISTDRENIYLLFGESDFVPGLHIQKLGTNILVQYYSSAWKKIEALVIETLSKSLNTVFPEWKGLSLWIQERYDPDFFTMRKGTIPKLKNLKHQDNFVIEEFGIKYNICLNDGADFGIYTDMATVKKQLIPIIEEADSLLNLYSYTGTFSLLGLKHNCKDVVSVDLSSKYLEWYNANLELNSDLNPEHSQTIQGPALKVAKNLIKEGRTFDLVICDPPSASSDGKKMSSSFKDYETLLPELLKLCSLKGRVFITLNTHKINWNKFLGKIDTILNGCNSGKEFKVERQFKLGEDCAILSSFKEGNYLKGVLLKRS